MEQYMLAVTLPVRGRYLPLHKHHLKHQMSWTARDREDYFKLIETVEHLYAKGPAGMNIPKQLLDVLLVKGLSSIAATNRILPYYVHYFGHRHYKIAPMSEGSNTILGKELAALSPTPHGIRFAVIGKGVERLSLLPSVLEEVSRRRGSEFTEEELHTLDGRSDPNLLDIVSNSDEPVVSAGEAKIVAVPSEALVNLSRTHRGEFIREVPRVWA